MTHEPAAYGSIVRPSGGQPARARAAARACTPTRPPVGREPTGVSAGALIQLPHVHTLTVSTPFTPHFCTSLLGHATPHTHVPPNSRTIMQHEPRTWPGATQKSTRHVPLTLSLKGGLSI